MNIRNRLKGNAEKIVMKNGALSGFSTKSAYIFDSVSMNFYPTTYLNIICNSDWIKRLDKTHPNLSGKKEMQSSNSSDVLLMNIFCHPDILKWKGIRDLLNIREEDEIIFGWNPIFINENPNRPTEVDMRIGNHIFEAKLTENSFTSKDTKTVFGYEGFHDVFDISMLAVIDNKVSNYQLIRNILAAYKYELSFNILIDSSRIDLIRELFNTVKAIKISKLACRVNFITWQEISNKITKDLREYIEAKYF